MRRSALHRTSSPGSARPIPRPAWGDGGGRPSESLSDEPGPESKAPHGAPPLVLCRRARRGDAPSGPGVSGPSHSDPPHSPRSPTTALPPRPLRPALSPSPCRESTLLGEKMLRKGLSVPVLRFLLRSTSRS